MSSSKVSLRIEKGGMELGELVLCATLSSIMFCFVILCAVHERRAYGGHRSKTVGSGCMGTMAVL